MKGRSEKVIEGVWLVGDGRLSDPKDCCVYLVDGGGEMALVDTGAGENPDAILRNVESVGKNASQIKWILITHCHIDHIGGIDYLRRKTGAKVMSHVLCAETLATADNVRTAANWYGISLEPIAIDSTFDGPEEKVKFGSAELILIHTPGHSPDSISIYADFGGKRVLFGQDIHGPFSPSFGSDIKLWEKSMEKLIALKIDILCEGHYGVIRGRDRVEDFIRSFLDRSL
jgi:glyoxylase-like metal-dependent hydrolase (beta-lactamase superfamily II)